MKLRTKILVASLLLAFIVIGCPLSTKPVVLAPMYRTQLESAVTIIEELEQRNALGQIDPNDFAVAMKSARTTLQLVLEADETGIAR